MTSYFLERFFRQIYTVLVQNLSFANNSWCVPDHLWIISHNLSWILILTWNKVKNTEMWCQIWVWVCRARKKGHWGIVTGSSFLFWWRWIKFKGFGWTVARVHAGVWSHWFVNGRDRIGTQKFYEDQTAFGDIYKFFGYKIECYKVISILRISKKIKIGVKRKQFEKRGLIKWRFETDRNA